MQENNQWQSVYAELINIEKKKKSMNKFNEKLNITK